MYVANSGDDTISVIDMTTNTVVGGPIKVGDGPRGIAYDLVSDRMYVANSLDETVSVINFC
jgi:YVTN family beta-propeller protein